MSTQIGRMIKQRREELGLTQEELALKMGYKSKSTINKIEMGINDVTQSKIIAFSKTLNIPPSYLMGWDANDPKSRPLDLEHIFADYSEYMLIFLSSIIKIVRIEKNCTERDLAQKSSVSLNEYLEFEVNNKNIGINKIANIINSLNLNFYYIEGLLAGFKIFIDAMEENLSKEEIIKKIIGIVNNNLEKLF